MSLNIFGRIKSLQIQGATNIAIASLIHLRKFSRKKGFGHRFDMECKRLLETRPTAVVLHNVINELKKKRTEENIEKILETLRNEKNIIGTKGERFIKNGYVVHTHCHSTEALAVIKEAAKKKRFSVVVDETRPRMQGIKTAKELSNIKKIKVILITDNAAGVALSPFLPPNDDIVIVGADALRKKGVVNKVGTYILAVIAKEQKIPFYVAASTYKIDKRKKFTIEERSKNEVHGKIKNVKIRNPAFDLTPWKYISGIITEQGVKKPKDIIRMLRK